MRRALVPLGITVALLAPRPARGAIDVYPVHGSSADWQGKAHGPGVVVMGGGTDVSDAFRWMHATIAGGDAAQGGDVVVLRDPDPNAGQDDAYGDYVLGLAPFASVRTIVLDEPTSAELAQAAAYVDRAEAVFFGGGDQYDYVRWNGALLDAVSRVYARGGVVGGTSAGAAILGQLVNDGIGQHAYGSTLSADALADPYERSITISKDVLALPPLAGLLVDTHFAARDRFGRLTAYMARLGADGWIAGGHDAVGVGVDEEAALVVDAQGHARLVTRGTGGSAWIARGGAAKVIAAKSPLVYPGLRVLRMSDGDTYDFARGCGSGTAYVVDVDATRAPAFTPSDPYQAKGTSVACPPAVDGGTDDAGTAGDSGDGGPSAPSPNDAGGGVFGSDAGRGETGGGSAGHGGAGASPGAFEPAEAKGCSAAGRREPNETSGIGVSLLVALLALGRARRRRPTL